jgi:hypothetical protein
MSSKFPTIPEFARTPGEIATALRAVKQSVEILTGQRQGESLGSPQIFIQAAQPNAAQQAALKLGDLWINTSTNKMNYWNGSVWQVLS